MKRRSLKPWKRRSGERGAVAVITAVVIGFTMLGLLALSVDVGGMTLERRQLQNAADSTAMALAQECATGKNCASTEVNSVANLLGANSGADGMSSFYTAKYPLGACMRVPAPPAPAFGVTLPLCDSAWMTEQLTDLSKCPPLPDWLTESGLGQGKIGYVETYSLTKTPNGGSRLIPFFGPSSQSTTQVSCARAAWGPGKPGSANVLALTMSECDWANQTGAVIDPVTGKITNTPSFPPGPVGYPGYDSIVGNDIPDWPANEFAVMGKNNGTPCDTSSPGGTAPGGFAWLQNTSCVATITNGWIQSDPGADTPCSRDQLLALRGTVIYVPVFDCEAKAPANPIPDKTTDPGFCSSGSGSNTYYHISGFAAFYFTGWYFGENAASKMESIKPPAGRYLCTNPSLCIFGWFTQSLIAPEDFTITPPGGGGSPDYGLTVVKPAG